MTGLSVPLEAVARRAAGLRRAARQRLSPLAPAPPRRRLFPFERNVANGGWTYHDECWVRVIDRDEHRRLLREGRALTVHDNHQEPTDEVQLDRDGSIHAHVLAKDRQSWVWLCLDPAQHMWRDFRWECTVRRDSAFRELQFGFRYIDFYNRYRFRHEHDQLHFDVVVNGTFRNSLQAVPFRMEPGRAYQFAIETRGNRFVLTVDGRQMLDQVDPRSLFPTGSIAVILWESDRRTSIRAAIRDIRVVET